MTVSYNSDFTPRNNTLHLIINHLLETFIAENIDTQHTIMQICIHVVFVLSALGITYMDKIGHTEH